METPAQLFGSAGYSVHHTLEVRDMYNGDIALLEEIAEQDFDGVAYGACTTNTFSLSDALGNDGHWCTLTVECQPSCG